MSKQEAKMSSRKRALDFILRFSLVTVEALHRGAFQGLSLKAAERTLANLRHDELVVAHSFLGKRKVYSLSRKAARRHGLDERRFAKSPGTQAMAERLAILFFCQQAGVTYLTAGEFAKHFARQHACPGLNRGRYVVDNRHGKPMLTLIVPDFDAELHRIVRKARRELAKRKQHQAFRDLINHGNFRIEIITASEEKARTIRDGLRADPFVHSVTVVAGLSEFAELFSAQDSN